MTKFIIDNKEIVVEKPTSILEMALELCIYIPHLCYHPALNPARDEKPMSSIYLGDKVLKNRSGTASEGCDLCLVEIEGKELVRSCSTFIQEGLVIRTSSKLVKERRKEILAGILENHPHDCLICEQAEGCDRKLCSKNIKEENRCCWKYGVCEFQQIVNFIGIDEKGVRPYQTKEFPLVDDNPLFVRNPNLCIGCLRCVVACRQLGGADALGFVYNNEGNIIVGPREVSLKKSGCKFCLACVEVCPTGALRDKDPKKRKSKIRASIVSSILPPGEDLIRLGREAINKIPEMEGVYRLWREDKELYQITGTENLNASLLGELENKGENYYFDYEENMMYTTRERQLIQQHLKKFGGLPPGNDADDDLF